jgi:uncharacterized membrane protein HdeD (DUF308 family)
MANTTTYDNAAEHMSFPWWLLLLQGVVSILVGLLLVTQPVGTTVLLVTFFGWYWLFAGIITLVSLAWNRANVGWRIASGLLSVIAGLWVISAGPIVGTIAVLGAATLVIGILGVLVGVSDLVRASRGAGWGVGVLGALSLIIGLAIVFDVPRYAVALPWVWGLLAIIGGVAAFVHSFTLRREQHTHQMPQQMHPAR